MYYYQPGGTSAKNIVHWLQILNGELRLFDYGSDKNLALYNSTEPPNYDLEALRDFNIPMFITNTDGDPYCLQHDFDNMIKLFTNTKVTVKKLSKYNHLDYLWAKTANADIYQDIIKFLNDS
jgi:hypothetical protein